MSDSYTLVAVPRRWVKNWMLTLFQVAFGHRLGAIRPFSTIMFRDLTAREKAALEDEE